MSIEKKYRKLSDVDHILVRPGMYVGSIKMQNSLKYVFNDGKFEKREVVFNPAFLKIFDEIVTNSVDESKRDGSKLNTIKVTIKDNRISIWDNGGIPVVKHKEHNEYIPEMIFSNLKAGSNFNDDEQRTTAGLNGVGSVLTNVFSKEFSISTCDSKNKFVQIFSNNMREKSKPSITKSTKGFTEISYIPDYSRFEMKELDSDHFKMIEKRVIDIAGTNPSLKVYFNGELIQIKTFEDYIKYYTTEYFYESNKDKSWSIGVAISNDGFQQVSFANSTDTYDGGTHVDYILSQIIVKMREFFQKKHKVDIKPSELRNHIFLFANTTIINPSFSSQTKEKLITEQKDFGYQIDVSDKLIAQILKSEIVESILDWIDKKKIAEENKLARELNKNISKVKVDKLIDAKGKDRMKCSLGLFEGDSAGGPSRKYRDANTQGFFSLRGKFINVSEITTQKISTNDEAINLMASIGLKFGQKVDFKSIRYGKIILYVDSDFDGDSIAALLINFFYKYWPELFEHKMIYKAETPILTARNLKTKKKISFYNLDEYNKWSEDIKLKEWEIKYKKGLAALVDDEYEEIICNPKLTQINCDDSSKEYLNIWFGKDADLRKNELMK